MLYCLSAGILLSSPITPSTSSTTYNPIIFNRRRRRRVAGRLPPPLPPQRIPPSKSLRMTTERATTGQALQRRRGETRRRSFGFAQFSLNTNLHNYVQILQNQYLLVVNLFTDLSGRWYDKFRAITKSSPYAWISLILPSGLHSLGMWIRKQLDCLLSGELVERGRKISTVQFNFNIIIQLSVLLVRKIQLKGTPIPSSPTSCPTSPTCCKRRECAKDTPYLSKSSPPPPKINSSTNDKW